jgi:RimJ/RimL family protein N-acetyltransferase
MEPIPRNEAMPLIRRLLPGDAARLAAHLKRLDADARRLRFGATLTDEAVDGYVRRIDWLRSLQFAQVEDGEIRAACQLAWRDPLWPSSAELAVSVERPLQDRGLGSELIGRTLVAARNRNIRHVTMVCLAENAKMRHIARKFESMLELADGDVSGRIDLDHPDHLSMLQELFAEGEAVMGAFAAGWAGPQTL